jgi:hypothetical protein
LPARLNLSFIVPEFRSKSRLPVSPTRLEDGADDAMNTAIIVMTILGCGHGETACEYVGTADTAFASYAECRAETAIHLKNSTEAGYPMIMAICDEHQLTGVADAAEPDVPVLPDIIIRRATVLDRIAEGMPDTDDVRTAVSVLAAGARNGVEMVSNWRW